jgi:amino acid adenylation domain-containing protein
LIDLNFCFMNKWLKREFWQNELARDIPVLDLKCLQMHTAGGVSVRMPVPAATRDRIDAITKGLPVGRYIYYLTCLNILLARYCYEEVIPVVSPLLGRMDAAEGGRVNLIVNTIDQRLSCRSLLNTIKEKMMEILPQQGVDADLRVPAGVDKICFIDEQLQSGGGCRKAQLAVRLRGDEICVESEDGFGEPYMTQLLSFLVRICDQVSLHPDRPVFEITFLDESEERELIRISGNRNCPELPERHFLSGFERAALEWPESPAVHFGYKTVTYRELNARANRIAGALAARGVVGGDRVVVLMDRSDKLLASILAIWKAGAIYVPVDPISPKDRIGTIIDDSGARLVLLEFKCRFQTSADQRAKHIFLESIETAASGEQMGLPARREERVAYIIYTSGSTGAPKGVMVEHPGMMNHLYAKIRECSIGCNSVVAQNASQSFDISIWQFLAPLLVGGRVRIFGDDTVKKIQEFIGRLAQDGVTILEVVPAYLSAAFELLTPEKVRECLRGLCHLLVTGEEFGKGLAKRCYSLLERTVIINAYGPTEASDDVTHHILNGDFDDDRIPIGKPLQNVNIYVVDPSGRICPDGIKGEIWISGIAVGFGYWGDPERTDASFTADPFVPDRGRLYKTGDIGARKANGEFLFFGRKDSQVKVNGCRIDLREIEIQLLRMEGIRDAVLLARKGHGSESYLHAYLLCTAEGEPEAGAIKAFLSTVVPPYMIPSSFTILESFPMLPSGKVDRKALDRLQGAMRPGVSLRPLTEKENWLVAIWENVLGLKDAGPGQNFFEAGGNSLNALQVVGILNKKLGSDFTFQDIFDHPTVESFAAKLPDLLLSAADHREQRQGQIIEI